MAIQTCSKGKSYQMNYGKKGLSMPKGVNLTRISKKDRQYDGQKVNNNNKKQVMVNKILHSKNVNFDDTKDIVRSRKIKKDRQYDSQNKHV